MNEELRKLEEKNNRYMRAKGKASGIPDCCINFYVDVWCPAMLSAARDRSNPTLGTLRDWQKKFKVATNKGYIPCPECSAKGTFVTVVETPEFPTFMNWQE